MLGTATDTLDQMVTAHTLGIAPMAFLAAAPWIALCVTMPTKSTAGVELAFAEYRRVQAAFVMAAPPSAIAFNQSDLGFPQAQDDWGDLVALEVWTAGPMRGSGVRLYFTPLVDPAGNPITQRVSFGGLVTIAAETLMIQAN